MNDIQSNRNNTQQRYFIFPGLRELLLGITVIVIIESLTGTSVLATLPLQHMFFATGLICVYLIFVTGLLVSLISDYSFRASAASNPYGILIATPLIFCSGFYLIGLIFPSLAVDYPVYQETFGVYLFNRPWHLLKCSWAILTQISHIYGWFMLIASGVLLLHIYVKHGSAISDKLNSL